MHLYALKGMQSLAGLLLKCMHVLPFLLCFFCLLSTIVFTTLSARGFAHSGTKEKINFAGQTSLLLVLRRIRSLKWSFWSGTCLWDFKVQKQRLWQYQSFESSKIIFHLKTKILKQPPNCVKNHFFPGVCFIGVPNVQRKYFFWLPFFVLAPSKSRMQFAWPKIPLLCACLVFVRSCLVLCCVSCLFLACSCVVWCPWCRWCNLGSEEEGEGVHASGGLVFVSFFGSVWRRAVGPWAAFTHWCVCIPHTILFSVALMA